MNIPEKRATILFLIRDNQILLAMKKRGFGAGRFNGVGGKPEGDETIEQTAIRECQEEICVTPTKFNEVGRINFYFPAEKAEYVWTKLLEEGERLGIETKPIGLAARDSLRFEAGMPLHGHEISPSINALEALFKWACDFDKDFIGKEALLTIAEKGLTRKLACIEVFGGVPREGYEVADQNGEIVGHCVDGMYCPTVKKYAANVFVRPELAKVGTPLKVMIRGQAKDAVVVKRPLYVPAYRR